MAVGITVGKIVAVVSVVGVGPLGVFGTVDTSFGRLMFAVSSLVDSTGTLALHAARVTRAKTKNTQVIEVSRDAALSILMECMEAAELRSGS